MEIIGYISAVLIGISLGLLGGGGSILTVPVLVYFFGIEPFSATTYSLFIVGIASFSGSAGYYIKGMIDFRIVLSFGLPSVASVFLSHRLILPAIPHNIIAAGSLQLTKNGCLMIVFAVLMIVSAISMIAAKEKPTPKGKRLNTNGIILLCTSGFLTGLVTGLLGAGGGFLIIPALVLCFGVDMKKAVAASLTIIAINSLLGFFCSIRQPGFEWMLFINITAIAVAGIFIGGKMAAFINTVALKRIFAVFVLMIAAFILFRELQNPV